MNKNPFVLPGFGQSGPMGQNPILASMEMMRQAWEGLASAGGLDTAAMGKMMSVEEMDKRIADLRAVENWLRMNLSMLTSTIQGLEVQRATVATLKSFMDTGMAQMPQRDPPAATPPSRDKPRAASPLEEVLGIKPAGQAAEGKKPGAEDSAAGGGHGAGAPENPAGQPGTPGEQGRQGHPDQEHSPQADIVGAAASAAQGWWNLLQQQFQTLAAATAASVEGGAGDRSPDASTPRKASAKSAASKTARRAGTAASGSTSTTAAKSASKAAARTTGKSASKTARKAPAARKAARKTAS